MKKIIAIFSIVSSQAVTAQNFVPQEDSLVAVDTAEPVRSTLTLAISFVNNASYYGQKSVEKTPYVAFVSQYHHKSGLYVSGMAYRLLKDSATFASAYNIGGGYDLKLSTHLQADFTYNYTFYAKLSPFLQASNPHNAGITITRTGWLNASLGLDYSFGKTNDYFATAGLSKEITLFNPSEKDVVSVSPSFDVTAGTQRFYQYYVEDKRKRDSLLGLPLLPVFGGGSNTNTTTTVKTKTQIELLSYNMKIPVSYSRSHYTVELSYQLSLLGNKAETGSGAFNSFFSGTFYYQF